MGSPFHVWWTVIWTSAIITIAWLIFDRIVEAFKTAALTYVTGAGLTTLTTIMTVWNWFPVIWILGMIFWAYVQSQKKDYESIGAFG